MRLGRLLEDPKVTVISDEASGKGRRRAELYVSGIVCETVCVTRPTVALRELPGVRRVGFDSDRQVFAIEYEGDAGRTDEFERAILRTVVARPVRRWLGRAFGR